MIVSLDINGFIPSTLDYVMRYETLVEGAACAVCSNYFEEWVAQFLCPILENDVKGEPQSIVVLDNASTHVNPCVGAMIRASGAEILHAAPHSLDINPIELGFNVCKSHLKIFEMSFRADWFGNHIKEINEITRNTCIKEFRRCGVSASDEASTSDETKQMSLLAISVCLISNSI